MPFVADAQIFHVALAVSGIALLAAFLVTLWRVS